MTTQQIKNVLCISVNDGRANAFDAAVSGLSEELARRPDPDIGAVVFCRQDLLAGFDLDVINLGPKAIGIGNGWRSLYPSGVWGFGAGRRSILDMPWRLVRYCCAVVTTVGDGPVKIGLNGVAIALTLPNWALLIASERLSRYLQVRWLTHRSLMVAVLKLKFLDDNCQTSNDSCY